MRRHVVTLVVCGLLAASGNAAAQARPWTDRGYANINFGFQPSPGDVEAEITRTVYQEEGLLNVNGQVDGGPLLDVSAGLRIWRNVSAGLGYHRVASDADWRVSGSVPHPVFFNRPREFSTDVTGLDRTESALHLSFGYMIVLNDRIDVHITGGPSFFWLSQNVVSDVTVEEAGPPFTSVTVTPQVAKRRDTPVGGHIGADVSYKFYERGRFTFRGGAFMRYAGGSADLQVINEDVSSDVGGFQFGFGLRTRF